MLSAPPGVLLGASASESYSAAATSLRPSDMVLFYTDGLVERRHEPIDDAIGRLLQEASDPPADLSEYADHLVERAPSDTEDDACLLVLSVRSRSARSTAPD